MKKLLKWGVIAIGGFFVLCLIVGLTTGDKKGASTNNALQKGMEQAKQTLESSETPVQETSQAKQVANTSGTVAQQIEAKVRASISGSNKFKDVQVTDFTKLGEGYNVFVTINVDDNLTTGFISKGIWQDMSNIYTALYKVPMNIDTVIIFADMNTVDKYGKTNNETVMKTRLTKAEAQKVNWNYAPKSTLDLQILPNVWETVLDMFK
ncbi:MAG: hypothetical protein NT141_03840 [candidate division WWE3 bacterium]|nr:hypothetical protein [candidate division WWE3 bacterium]